MLTTKVILPKKEFITNLFRTKTLFFIDFSRYNLYQTTFSYNKNLFEKKTFSKKVHKNSHKKRF